MGLNTEIYSVNFRVQITCGKKRTRKQRTACVKLQTLAVKHLLNPSVFLYCWHFAISNFHTTYVLQCPCEYCRISKNSFFIESLWWLRLSLAGSYGTKFIIYYTQPIWTLTRCHFLIINLNKHLQISNLLALRSDACII